MLPSLTPVEIRVLGSLIEKSRTTPDYYPMTLNSITAACNQKSSRFPVTDFSEENVQQALNSLKGQSLVANAIGGGSRVTKYKHNFGTVHDVSDAALAILCLLMLRGPQTPGELNTNSGRLYAFSGLEEIQKVLTTLESFETPYIKELPKRPGQKENRFVQLLGDSNIDDLVTQVEPEHRNLSFEDRLSELENEVQHLRQQVAKLLSDLGQ